MSPKFARFLKSAWEIRKNRSRDDLSKSRFQNTWCLQTLTLENESFMRAINHSSFYSTDDRPKGEKGF